jgi:hypothetical protein
MAALFKYVSIFFIFGIIWFMIFSIQISKSTTVFLVLQKQLKMVPAEEEDELGNKKTIDREKVIDAISKAFNQ